MTESIAATQNFATQWHRTNNNHRPTMTIDGITPAQNLKMAACGLPPHRVGNGGRTIELADRTSDLVLARQALA